MSSFDTDFAAIEDVFDELFGDTITVRRGPLVSGNITASSVAGDEMQLNDYGIPIKVTTRTWLIKAADYVIANITEEPASGDVIVYGSQEWEVRTLERDAAVEKVDGGTRYLVRTVQVE